MKKVLFTLSTAAILVACGGEDKTVKAETTPAKETQSEKVIESEAKPAVNTVTYNVVKDSSSVLNWTGSAVGKSHFGTVDYTGSVNVSEGKLVGGKLVFDMTSIDSKDMEGEWKEKLDGHLKAADFFNVDSFPNAVLVINGVEGANISGDLTIKDVTKSITFPASVTISDNAVIGTAEFTINRTEYGIVYGSGNFFDLAKDKIISDDIEFKVSINAAK